MKPEPVKSSELDRLIQRYLDGLLDEAERARLEGILRSSPDAARQLARAARFERLIERHMRRPVPVAPLLRPAPVRWWPIASWRRWREHAWGPLVAVALHAVLFAALIRWVIWPASSRRGDEVEITMEIPAKAPELDRSPEMPRDEEAPVLPETGIASAQRPPAPEPMPPSVFPSPTLEPLPRSEVSGGTVIAHPLVAERVGERRLAVQRELPQPLAEEVDRAVLEGLEWLASRQSADGRWREPGTDEIGLTSLALLALSARSESIRRGPHAERFRSAMDALASAMGAVDSEDVRSEVLRLNALADGQAVLRMPRWNVALEQSVARVLHAEHPEGGWGAGAGRPDPLVTAWAVMGLRVASALGVEVDRIRVSLGRAADALNRAPNPASGLWYYPMTSNRSAAELAGLAGTVLTLQLTGESAGARAVRGLRALEEQWNDPGRLFQEGGGFEAAWMTACAYQQAGGAGWLRFYGRCARALLAARTAEGLWTQTAGRPSVRATSLAVLTLETPWRYPPASAWPRLAHTVGHLPLLARR